MKETTMCRGQGAAVIYGTHRKVLCISLLQFGKCAIADAQYQSPDCTGNHSQSHTPDTPHISTIPTTTLDKTKMDTKCAAICETKPSKVENFVPASEACTANPGSKAKRGRRPKPSGYCSLQLPSREQVETALNEKLALINVEGCTCEGIGEAREG
jgi:hypothetical protein